MVSVPRLFHRRVILETKTNTARIKIIRTMQQLRTIEIARREAFEAFQNLLPSNPAPGEATEAYKAVDEIAYSLSRLPLGTARPMRIIVVGAGFSGLAFAREVETQRLTNVHLQIYEKNASIGGTWFENRYPG